MAKSFDGLAAATRSVIGQDPMSGHLFCFLNRKGDRIKILFWDRNGYALYYKRLEAGTFQLPKEVQSGAKQIALESSELSLMLEGIDLRGAKRRKRWQPKRPMAKAA